MRKRDLPCSEDCGRLVGPKGSHGRCGGCQQKYRRGQRPKDLAEWVVAHYPDLVLDALGRETL